MVEPVSPVVRVVDAGLGPDAQVRLAVARVPDLDKLQRTWASSGAALERVGDRIHATTTVEALVRAAGRAFGPDWGRRMEGSVRSTVGAWTAPARAVPLPLGRSLRCDVRPLVMGVVNVTPDSFSDGGVVYPDEHPEAAVALGTRLVEEGADVLDVGGESTRPGAEPVPEEEERRRTLPVVERLAASGVVVSVDTGKASVARAAVAAGAAIVNDVTGGRDPELLDVVAASGAAYVLMHSRGTPADMQERTDYADVVAEVYEFLADGIARCKGAGIPAERILVDPGIGFAKQVEHNVALLRGLRQLRGLGRPVVVGVSRKSFLGALLGGAPVEERLEGGLACAALAVQAGVAVVRVHDVAPTVRTVRVAAAVAAGA